MSEIADRIERAVLQVHRLNGGKMAQLNLNVPLSEPGLAIDQFEMMQLLVAIEQAFECSLRRHRGRLRTWRDLVEQVERSTRYRSRD